MIAENLFIYQTIEYVCARAQYCETNSRYATLKLSSLQNIW